MTHQQGSSWVIRGSPNAVFSHPQHGPRLLRLMIAMNGLDTLHRALLHTMVPEFEEKFSRTAAVGDRVMLLGLLYGALTESLQAYEADRGTIEALARRADPANTEMEASITTLQSASRKDKSDPTTFRNRIAERVRVEVGFHWNVGAIECARKELTERADEVMFRSDPTSRGHLARFVYADAIAARVTLNQDTSGERTAAIAEAIAVTKAFIAVVEAAIAQAMIDAGCRREEVPPSQKGPSATQG